MHGDCKISQTLVSANPLQRPFLCHSDGALQLPDLDYLNTQAIARQIGTGGGLPLRFALPNGNADYEQRAFDTGVVATRAENWHDAFNALVWLNFPLSKAALNMAHLASRSTNSDEKGQRGRARDVLTQFDECGVVFASTSPALWQALRSHQWSEVFVARRAELLATTRFIVFGHGSLDALRAPFVGLCGKAVFVAVSGDLITDLDAGNFSTLDVEVARRVTSTNWRNAITQPLPLLGIPGATVENNDATYYQNSRQFRPLR